MQNRSFLFSEFLIIRKPWNFTSVGWALKSYGNIILKKIHPFYMEVKKDNIILHLSEHHGDGTPGTNVFIWGEGVPEYHKELLGKNYKYNRPGLEKTFYNAISFTVNDPFGNKIIFNEEFDEEKHGDLKLYSNDL